MPWLLERFTTAQKELGQIRHWLREFPSWPRKVKFKWLGILSLAIFWPLISLTFWLKSPPQRGPLSPIVPWERAEVAITRLAPKISPFQKKAAAGFKALSQKKNKKLQYEVFGFIPYWTFDKIPYLRFDLISTLAYFGLEINAEDGALIKDNVYWSSWDGPEMRDLIVRAKAAQTKVVVTLKLFDNGPIERFLACNRCLERTIAETRTQVGEKDVQGINVDFEYLGTPPREVVIRFSQFVRDLSDGLKKDNPKALVSLAVYATSAREERLYNVALTGDFIDYFFIMGYDFFRPASTHAGPVSPLTGVEKYGYDLQTAVADFLQKVGAEKIVLGVPYYGYEWPVEGATPNSKVLELGEKNGGVGVLYYEQTAELEKSQAKLVQWDGAAEVPFYTHFDPDHKVWRQLYFENARSLGQKFDFIKSQKIRGLGIWALGFDGARPELWDLLEKTFTKL